MSGRCPPSSELSALLDLGLSAQDRERVQSHLLECYLCRDELADLRKTRELVNRSLNEAPLPASPSADFSARLIKIAGEAADQPLRTRPFDGSRHGAATLPSRARRHRNRGLTASVVVSLLLGLVATGWLAAPDVEASAVNPGSRPRAMLIHSLEQRPMGADPALSLLSTADLERFRTDSPAREPAFNRKTALTPGQLSRLARSTGSAQTMGVSGLHRAWLRVGEHGYQATARVDSSPGQGSEISLYDVQGVLAQRGHLPDGADRLPMSLLASHYRLQGFASAGTVAGVATDLVEASADGRVTARWWIEPRTAMVLWHSSYAPDGRLAASAGLLEMQHAKHPFVAHMGPVIATTTSGANQMPLASVPTLTEHGCSCAAKLAGLPLTQMAHAGPLASAETVVYSSYGDGLFTTVLSQQQGALPAAPPGLIWDVDLAAYRNAHNPAEVTWQSGQKVFTLTTSGGEDHLREAVAALPHEPPVLRTRTERILAGWRVIFGMKG